MSNFNFEYGPKWIEENGSYTFVVNNTEKSPVIEVKSDFSFLPDSAYNPSFKTIKFTITNDDNGTTLNQFTISGKNKIQFNLDESLSIINELKVKKAYLTHISHNLGLHKETSKKLPKNVKIAYDSLKIYI